MTRHILTHGGALALAVALTALAAAPPAAAQAFDSGSTGALGALIVEGDTEIPLPPDGVLHYTDIDIGADATVTFKRNADNTPVVLLASGDVLIAGTIDVSAVVPGQTLSTPEVSAVGALGGPGGSDGGASFYAMGLAQGQAGYGPAGGEGTQQYNNSYYGGAGGASAVAAGGKGNQAGPAGPAAPASAGNWLLHGGSGGGSSPETGGGGGGGVITIAASGSILFDGTLYANGGTSLGSKAGNGGAGVIRLVATEIHGQGSTQAVQTGYCSAGNSWDAGCGGAGLIRFDAFDMTGSFFSNANPAPTLGLPAPAVPYPFEQRPTLRIAVVAGQDAPAGDTTGYHPLADPSIVVTDGTTIAVTLETEYVPLGTVVKVVAATLGYGTLTVDSTPVAGTFEAGTATADIDIPAGTRVGTVHAFIPQLPKP